MTVLTEGTHAGEFILSEAPGSLSRENAIVVVPAATTLPAGAVLALGVGGWAPITDAITTGDVLGVLYVPLTNADDEAADMAGVVIERHAEVRGADLDWNAQAAAVQETAITLLDGRSIKVRNYTPLGS